MKKKEIYWIVGTLVLVLILTLAIFGMDGLKSDSTWDINIHDTYFVIANFHLIPLIFVFTFFVVYLIRTTRRNFKNITSNLILMIVTILFVLVLGKLIAMLDFFGGPNNNQNVPLDKSPVENAIGILSKVMFVLQIGLLILLSYCGFKTGRNYNGKK
ncbi:hypothetical protein [Croceitalea vernalis]|uniref:Uncharacterized protein n=1 Tax=Croceitalea vernalis TaxID=3075599 RepID=A0ABU3BLG5_9FLAO|nr:hypothetical protein [Croceitalea sp. P007]MDT0622945.1 hypothetical protein [Croceitalea sp. P007]